LKKLLLLFLVFAGLASATGPTVVNSVLCQAAVTTCATTWNVTSGNIVVVSLYDAQTNVIPTLSDDQSNTYTSLATSFSYHSNVGVSGAVLATGGSTLTVTTSSAITMMTIAEISGATLTQDVTAVIGNDGGTQSLNKSITTATANDIVLMSFVAGDYSPGLAITTTGTNLFFNHPIASRACILNYEVGAAATYTYSVTGIQGNGGVVIVALKAAGGGGAAPVHMRKVRSN
jgi:hypothetical protein